MRPLLEGHPLLDGFLALPAPGLDRRQSRAAVQTLADQIRARTPDAFVHLHPDALCQRAARAAGVPRRIGYRHSFFLDRTLTDRLPRPPRRRHCGTRREYNFDLLAPLGIRPPPDPTRSGPRVHLPESWLDSLRIRLAAAGFDRFDDGDEPYAVLNPTAFSLGPALAAGRVRVAGAANCCNPGRFARVILVGDHLDDPSAREIRHLLGPGLPGLIDLSGATNLAELGWLLRHARLLVSRNTGTTHLAAAVGCPTVELFGRLEPHLRPGALAGAGRAGGGRFRPARPAAARREQTRFLAARLRFHPARGRARSRPQSRRHTAGDRRGCAYLRSVRSVSSFSPP